jgi:hypothetical protein
MKLYEPQNHETELGRTSVTPSGYCLVVSRADFSYTNAGERVRLTLIKGDRFVRHLDLTYPVAVELRDLLQRVTL